MAPSAPTPGKSAVSRRSSHLTRHKTPIRREDAGESSFAAWWNVDALVEANNNLTPFRKQKYEALNWVNADLLLEEDGAEFIADDPFATPAPQPPNPRKQLSIKRRRSGVTHGVPEMSARRASLVKQRDLTLADLTPRSRRISAARTSRVYLREASIGRLKTSAMSPDGPSFTRPLEQGLTPIVEGHSRHTVESPRVCKSRPSTGIKAVASPPRARPSAATQFPATPSKTPQRENGTPSVTPRSRPRQYRVLPQDKEPETPPVPRRKSINSPRSPAAAAAAEEIDDEELHRSIPGAFDFKPAPFRSFTETLPNQVLGGLKDVLDPKTTRQQPTAKSKADPVATSVPKRGTSGRDPDTPQKPQFRVNAPAVKSPGKLTKDVEGHTTRTTTREPKAPTAPKTLIFSRKPVAKPQTRTQPKAVDLGPPPLSFDKNPVSRPLTKQQSSTASQPKDCPPEITPTPVDLPLLKPSPVIIETAACSQQPHYSGSMPTLPDGRKSEPPKEVISRSKRLEEGKPNGKDPRHNSRSEDRAPLKSPVRTPVITEVVPRNDTRSRDKAPAPPQVFRPHLQESTSPKPAKPTCVKPSPKVVSKKRALENSPSKREAEERSVKRKRLVVSIEASKYAADRLNGSRKAEATKPTATRQTSPSPVPQKARANSNRHEQGAPTEPPLSRPKVSKAKPSQPRSTVTQEAPAPLVVQLVKEHDVFGSVLENSIDLASINRLRRGPVEIFESAEPQRSKEEAAFKDPARQRSLTPPRRNPSPVLPSTLRARPSHESFTPAHPVVDSYKEVEQGEPHPPDAHDGKLGHQRSHLQEDEFCTLTVPHSPKFILGRQRHEDEKAEKERGRWSNLARRQNERLKRDSARSMPPVAAKLLATLAGLQTSLHQRPHSKPLPSKEFTFVSDLRLSLETEQGHKQQFEAKRNLWEQRVLEASNSSVESTQHQLPVKSAPSKRHQEQVQRAPVRPTEGFRRVLNETKRTVTRAPSGRNRALDLLVPKQSRPVAMRHDRMAF